MEENKELERVNSDNFSDDFSIDVAAHPWRVVKRLWKSVKDQRLKLAAVIFSVVYRSGNSVCRGLGKRRCANLSFIVDVSRGMGILYASILFDDDFCRTALSASA